MSYNATRLRIPPGTSPEVSDIVDQLQRELDLISKESVQTDLLYLKELHVAPLRPRAGMIVLADGTDWNPGSGAGFYGYYAGSWKKLG